MVLRNYEADNQAATNCPNATETVVCQLDGVNQGAPGNPIGIKGWFNGLTGVGATTITLRIRRGTTVAGTVIGQAAPTPATASVNVDAIVAGTDISAAELGNQSYVLTATVAGGAVAMTAAGAHLSATVA